MVPVKPIVAVAMLLVLSTPVSASPARHTAVPAWPTTAHTLPLHHNGMTLTTTISGPVAHPGDHEVQTSVVTNTGYLPITEARVTTDLASDCVRTIPWLPPHSSRTVTCSGTAGDADQTITAAVRGTLVFGRVVSAQSSTTVRVIHPAIEVHASAAPETTVPGQRIDYTVGVTNGGDTTVSGLALVAAAATGCEGPLAPLSAGEATTVRCSVTAGQQGDSVTFAAAGHDELGETVGASASAEFTVVHPSLDLVVTGPDRPVAPGGTATVTVRLRNTSTIAIADIRVTGTPAACERTVGTLDAGADAVYTCLVTVTGPTTIALTVLGLPVIGGTVVTTSGYQVTQTTTLRLAAAPPPPTTTTRPPPPPPTTTPPRVVPTTPPARSAVVPPPPPPTTTPPPPPVHKAALDEKAGPLHSPATTAAVIAVLGVLVMTVSVGALGAASRPK